MRGLPLLWTLVALWVLASPPLALAQPGGAGCARASCHTKIEAIRPAESGMMRRILARGRKVGDPEGCTVCHGGRPGAPTSAEAHAGAPAHLGALGGPKRFLPDPGSPWINDRSCGQCHAELVRTQWNNLMMTEAGKIQGTAWSFGAAKGYDHVFGNYDARNPTEPSARLGTEAYRAYMAWRSELLPEVYPRELDRLPEAPIDGAGVEADPSRAAFTYLRTECQRCHLAVRGRQRRGDYRGMGCSACHIPYSNEGLYEGADATIPREKPGHLLVHQIQGTRDTAVTVGKVTYRGIPVETCTTCHNRGKRIGVSFQGLMEAAWASPYTEGGGGQIALHTKHYVALHRDIHLDRGMLCQDCHTSGDVHGDGFIAASNLAQTEIECADCHGTPKAYPWELPLGWGDDVSGHPLPDPERPRGVAEDLPEHLRKGVRHPAGDGYLLTARGNPMPEVVREGDAVIVHTAGGKDLRLEPLKLKMERGALSAEAETAMAKLDRHMERMECYACHARWAPQCYGCHVKVDYSSGKKHFDWVAAGGRHRDPAHAADRGEAGYDTLIGGTVTELRSYMRWEDPPLGVNGEERVTPLIPGCQVSATIIAKDGRTVVRNHIFRTPPGTEGGGPEGQLSLDMSPVQPHTMGHARPCVSCHGSEKAAGYGIGGDRVSVRWNRPTVVDLTTADGVIIPGRARPQIEPVEGLKDDWSRIVDREGRQTQTVGHHFPGSRPLNDHERATLERAGVCVACHQEVPEGSLAGSLLHHVASAVGALPHTDAEHSSLIRKALLLSAWVQVGAPVALAFALGLWLRRRRRRRRRARTRR